MIVTTMNTEETYREVMRDYQCLQQKVLQSSLSFQLEMARKKILTTAKTFTYQRHITINGKFVCDVYMAGWVSRFI